MKKINGILLVKIIFASFAILFFILGIVYATVEMPIEGSIYKTNTSRAEREETWEKEFEERYKIYDEGTDVIIFENQVQKSSFLELLYRHSYSSMDYVNGTKDLRLEIINNSKLAVMSIYSIKLENRDDETDVYSQKASDRIMSSGSTETYLFTVPIDFDIDDYSVSANSVKYDNYTYRTWFVTSFERELEITKSWQISLWIYEEIGERPTIEYESTDPLPDYLVAINDNISLVIGWFFFSLIFGLPAIFIKNRKTKKFNNYSFNSNNFDVINDTQIIYETQSDNTLNELKEELKEEILEEIQRKTRVKKVVCLHCESRYDDSLDECPNCGSTKIDSTPEDKTDDGESEE